MSSEITRARDGYEVSQRIYAALFDLGVEFPEAQHAFELLADDLAHNLPYETASVMQGYCRCNEDKIDDLLAMEFVCPDCSNDPCDCQL